MMKWKENWEIIDEKPMDGGQGSVFQVVNKSNGTKGALKIMHESQIGSSKRRSRFEMESNALAKLEHSNTPDLLEYNPGNKDESPYFISSWITGVTLNEFSSNQPIPIDQSLNITRTLALTLDEAHRAGIVHRDIKPSNIIIEGSNIKLIDFGLCYIEDVTKKSSTKTPLGEELGNRFLRLPELTAGSENKHEKICDVTFLVGILFYLCTGKPPRQLRDSENKKPHKRLTDDEIAKLDKDPLWSKIQRIFNVGFEQNSNLRFNTAIELISYIDKAMETNEPKEESLDEVKQELKEMLQSEEVQLNQQLVKDITQLNRDLSKYVMKELAGDGLTTGGNNNVGPNMHKVNMHFRHGQFPGKLLVFSHEIIFDEEEVNCKYHYHYTESKDRKRIVDTSESTHYYSGKKNDLESLAENVEKSKDEFIAKAVKMYMK